MSKQCPLFEFCNCKTAVCRVLEPDESCYYYHYFKKIIEENNMREPSRINIFCGRLANLWQQVPDWRFGQLICNAFAVIKDDCPFYLEDEEMIEYLENYIKKVKGES